MPSYAKLFSHILQSTVWQEDDHTRLIWITMLALKDEYGIVHASVPGLARSANVPLSATRVAIAKLCAPDPDSRTKDFEGRRIEEVDGGWRVLNHIKYQRMMSKEARLEQKRECWHKHKDRYRPKVEAALDTMLDKLDKLDTAEQSRCNTSPSAQAKQAEQLEDIEDFWELLAVFLKRQRLLAVLPKLREVFAPLSLENLEKLIALTIVASRLREKNQPIRSPIEFFKKGIERENYEDKDLKDAKQVCLKKFGIL